jgi:hypothetical protein
MTQYYRNYLKGVYSLSWEAIFKGQFGGTILSRLYTGTWNIEDVYRNLNFNISRAHITSRLKKVDFFNASSLASYTLIKMLGNEKKTKSNRPKWYEPRKN